MGVPSVVILAAYVVGVRLIGAFERRRVEAALDHQADVYHYDRISVRHAASVFAVLCSAITGLGLWLAALGDQIAARTGLGASFVGTIFLAITTSLPEIVASFAALRIGAVDLAISNVFGSNIFNIAALAVYDVVDVRGNLWQRLNPIHGVSAVAAALMTAVTIVGLIYQAPLATELGRGARARGVSWQHVAGVPRAELADTGDGAPARTACVVFPHLGSFTVSYPRSSMPCG